jgi:hypothetical protein
MGSVQSSLSILFPLVASTCTRDHWYCGLVQHAVFNWAVSMWHVQLQLESQPQLMSQMADQQPLHLFNSATDTNDKLASNMQASYQQTTAYTITRQY